MCAYSIRLLNSRPAPEQACAEAAGGYQWPGPPPPGGAIRDDEPFVLGFMARLLASFCRAGQPLQLTHDDEPLGEYPPHCRLSQRAENLPPPLSPNFSSSPLQRGAALI